MPTKSVMGQHTRRSLDPSSRARVTAARRSDLRFAGMISAGMIATVVTIGVLLAPLLAWNDNVARNAGDRSQTLRLSDLPKQATAPSANAESFAVDRPSDRAARRVREALGSRDGAAGSAPSSTRSLGIGIRKVDAPSRTTPLARASDDSDGDGMPDIWERAYGLNPNDASDATQDADGDGLDNRTEMRVRTAPTSTDSDSNGVADGDEDSDSDGLRNKVEIAAGADPSLADSNHDGIGDALDDSDGDGANNIVEQTAGTDPGSGEDVPPILGGDDPTPIAPTEPDDDVEDDGGDTGTPPAPDSPEAPVDPPADPAPAPDIPLPVDDGGDQPAPVDDGGVRRRRGQTGDDGGQPGDDHADAATTISSDGRRRPAPTRHRRSTPRRPTCNDDRPAPAPATPPPPAPAPGRRRPAPAPAPAPADDAPAPGRRRPGLSAARAPRPPSPR